MERFLLQLEINGRWVNFYSFEKRESALLVIKLLKHQNSRVLDRIEKKYF
jgi:hypothetical protein